MLLGLNSHIHKYLIKEIEKLGIEEMRQKTKKNSKVGLKNPVLPTPDL